ncbi:MAG: low affinity iron permease family protein [Rhizobium sp.]|nr:low affinity iron permease family protein [Rhizobium sp.]
MAGHVNFFSRFATAVSEWSGRPVIFFLAVGALLLWGLAGPYLDYSSTWQALASTGATLIAFLMVFILQNTQMRDTRAIQTKLDELILTSHRAENHFIGIESLDENELKKLNQLIAKAAAARGAARGERMEEVERHVEEALGKDAEGSSSEEADERTKTLAPDNA